jgi:hypothetical protein
MTADRPPKRRDIYRLIDTERERQLKLWGRHHQWGTGDCSSALVDMPVKLAVLTEEVGEVARAILDRDDTNLRDELVQVAAVAIAMIEGLDT